MTRVRTSKLACLLRTWLACAVLALSCAPVALQSARAQVVLVAEVSSERAQPPSEQACEVSAPSASPVPSACAFQREASHQALRTLPARQRPALYLEHCALLL
jgi:hypothetical protein